MAILEFAMRDHLAGNVAVAAVVGTRIFPVRIPRTALAPTSGASLTYQRKSATRDYYTSAPTGHPIAKIEVSSWSTSYDQAKALANAVRLAMDGFTGTFSTGLAAVVVSVVTTIDEEDEYYPLEDGSDGGWFAVHQTFQLRYNESLS